MRKLRKVWGDNVECVAMNPVRPSHFTRCACHVELELTSRHAALSLHNGPFGNSYPHSLSLPPLPQPAVFGHPSVQGNAAACALTREEDFYVWWPRSYTHTFQGDHESLDFALRATRAFIEEHGPFDCCIGFSQGANFLAHLLPLLEKPWLHEAFASPTPSFLSPRSSISASSDGSSVSRPYSVASSSASTPFSPPQSPTDSDYFARSRRSSFGEVDVFPVKPFKCAILVGAYGPADPIADHWFDSPVRVPTLHLIGKNDAWIPPSRSRFTSLFMTSCLLTVCAPADYQVDTAAKFNSKTLWHIGGASLFLSRGRAQNADPFPPPHRPLHPAEPRAPRRYARLPLRALQVGHSSLRLLVRVYLDSFQTKRSPPLLLPRRAALFHVPPSSASSPVLSLPLSSFFLSLCITCHGLVAVHVSRGPERRSDDSYRPAARRVPWGEVPGSQGSGLHARGYLSDSLARNSVRRVGKLAIPDPPQSCAARFTFELRVSDQAGKGL